MADHDQTTAAEPQPQPGAILIGFLIVAGGLLLIFANSTGIGFPHLLPEAISTYAEPVDALFYWILGVTGFFFVLTEGLLIYFMVKYRARDGGKASHTHGHHTLELIWTFIPGLILFCLAVFQTGTWGEIKLMANMPRADDPDVFTVQVYAKQFEWHFRYPGPDKTFGTNDDITSRTTDLHVPVHTKVLCQLRTRDVLHSFFLPNVRLKQDLLPGHMIPQWFEVTVTGNFEIMCAELCGTGHTKMRGNLIVHTREELDAWLAEELAKSMKFGGKDFDDVNSSPHWYFWDRRYVREHSAE